MLDRAEYDKLDRAEDRMWWFAALHANVLMLCRCFAPAVGSGAVLDAGCGTGGLLARLATACPGAASVGLDLDPGACASAAAKTGRPLCAGSVQALPFADAAFAIVLSADVLCHAGVDERAALVQFRRVLRDDGFLIVNLPAYRWMMSRHDVAVRNVRRYTRRGVARLLDAAGFRLLFASYWNMLLFPMMVLTRKVLPAGDSGSDVRLYPAPVDVLCRAATRLETALLRARLRLPFGGSVIAVAAKAPQEAHHA